MREQIEEGFMVFVSDGDEGIGSIREIRRGLPELLIYIENAGDFVVPASAVKAVHSGKVILDFDRLDLRLRDAIRHARDSEDADYIPPASRSEEHTSELQSLMRISYAVFCLKKKKKNQSNHDNNT